MKKLLSVILSVALIISFTSCSKKSGSSDETEAGTVSEQTTLITSRVSYLGPEGTYTQEACGLFFDDKGELIPCGTAEDAVNTLISGGSRYAVIPQENTIGGPVNDYLDILINYPDVYIAGEVELTIDQNLLIKPGASLEDITTVYSHPQGIAQGREWLDENLPDAEVIEVSSTAEGARMAAESEDDSCAAIASAACGDVYGLEIAATAIQGNDSNQTRFYVLAAGEAYTDSSDRIAFIASGDASNLPALMVGMYGQGMTLISIHDRPMKTELGEYYYLIECADSDYEMYERLAGKSGFDYRFLGSFEVR